MARPSERTDRDVSTGSSRKRRQVTARAQPPLRVAAMEETEAYCRCEGIEFRTDESNRDTKRGLIREEILPRLRELHPGADRNLLRLAEGRPSALDELLASTAGSKRLDLGGGLTAVREYDRVWVEQTPGRSQRRSALGRVADRLGAPRP